MPTFEKLILEVSQKMEIRKDTASGLRALISLSFVTILNCLLVEDLGLLMAIAHRS